MSVPYEYDYLNAATARQNPSTMHAYNTGLARFYRRYLTQKAISVFEFDLPESWAKNFFEYTLFICGHVAIIKADKFGVIPQYCTLSGYNQFYQPSRAIVTNPAFRRSYDLRIGAETEIIKLTPDYGGVWDLISFYADLLAICAETAGVNALNSKLSYVFAAYDKASAESYKKLFDQIASGQPATVVDKKLLDDDGNVTWHYFAQNLQQNFIAPEVLQLMRQIEAEFDTVIGIPNANTDKRERLITDEVNANNVETFSRVKLWLETIREDMDRANKMFGLNLAVRLRKEDNNEVYPVDPRIVANPE